MVCFWKSVCLCGVFAEIRLREGEQCETKIDLANYADVLFSFP